MLERLAQLENSKHCWKPWSEFEPSQLCLRSMSYVYCQPGCASQDVNQTGRVCQNSWSDPGSCCPLFPAASHPPTQFFLSCLLLVVGDSFKPRPVWTIASLVLTLSCLGVWLSLVFYFLEIIRCFFLRKVRLKLTYRHLLHLVRKCGHGGGKAFFFFFLVHNSILFGHDEEWNYVICSHNWWNWRWLS